MNVQFNDDDLRPLVHAVVTETLAHRDSSENATDRQIAYTTVQAAAKLGVPYHRLRDAVERGDISPTGKLGKSNLFSHATLVEFAERFRHERN